MKAEVPRGGAGKTEAKTTEAAKEPVAAKASTAKLSLAKVAAKQEPATNATAAANATESREPAADVATLVSNNVSGVKEEEAPVVVAAANVTTEAKAEVA